MLGCSVVSDFATLLTITCQTPLSVKFFRQEYWSGLPFPTPRDLSDPGIELVSPALWILYLPSLWGSLSVKLGKCIFHEEKRKLKVSHCSEIVMSTKRNFSAKEVVFSGHRLVL